MHASLAASYMWSCLQLYLSQLKCRKPTFDLVDPFRHLCIFVQLVSASFLTLMTCTHVSQAAYADPYRHASLNSAKDKRLMEH